MDALFLVLASFFTSALTAVIGVGGGMLLISLMPGAIPIAAIMPVHGAVQLVSNASRVLLGVRHIEWSIFWPFPGGARIGAWAGAPLAQHLPTQYMPLLLGLFIFDFHLVTQARKVSRLPGHFTLMGATQTFIALFVGVSGPLTNAFLLREALPRDRLVVTHGLLMTATHALKMLAFVFMGFAFCDLCVAYCSYVRIRNSRFLCRHIFAWTRARKNLSHRAKNADYDIGPSHDFPIYSGSISMNELQQSIMEIEVYGFTLLEKRAEQRRRR